jgi:hypothetical protein
MFRLVRSGAASAAVLLLAACASAAKSPAGSSQSEASPSASQVAIANAIEVANAPFVGSLKSKKFYPASCHTVKLIKAAERIGFASIKDAQDAGFAKDLYSTDCQY